MGSGGARHRRWAVASTIVVIATFLTGCTPIPGPDSVPTHAPVEVTPVPTPTPAPTPAPTPTPTPTPSETKSAVTFVAVVDGDTIETSEGTVRIIGIDTPERGECGYREAGDVIGRLLSPGDTVDLVHPTGVDDVDRYDRLLRYVATGDGTDVGLSVLKAGYAVARYDSTDGYPRHPKQAKYHAAEAAALDAYDNVVAVGCELTAPGPAPAAEAGTDDGWWFGYGSCAKLKKSGSGHPTGPFSRDDPAEAAIYDWFANGTGNRGDGDGDGLACE